MDDMFLAAARALADTVTAEDLAQGSLYPPLTSIRDASLAIAVAVAEVAYARVSPRPNGQLTSRPPSGARCTSPTMRISSDSSGAAMPNGAIHCFPHYVGQAGLTDR